MHLIPNYILAFVITYMIYVLPLDILNYLIFYQNILNFSSLLITLFTFALILFYLKTKNTFFLLKLFVFEGMGIGFISLWITSFGLAISKFFFLNSVLIGHFCLILISCLVFFSLYKGRTFFLKKIYFSSPKISKDIKLLFISDVHLGSNNQQYLNKIIKKIKDLEFDFLIIGGDLIDSSNFNIKELGLLKILKKPIIFVSGNHEYYLDGYKQKLNQLNMLNIKFLDNESLKYKKINFIGISDNQELKKKKKIVNNLIEKNLYNLVLVHKPSLWNHVYESIDLMLCGHTHNGQIFPFNFFVRLKFKNIFGIYKKNSSNLYVSSGVGCWGPKMRLGSSNEIVLINILKSKS